MRKHATSLDFEIVRSSEMQVASPASNNPVGKQVPGGAASRAFRWMQRDESPPARRSLFTNQHVSSTDTATCHLISCRNHNRLNGPVVARPPRLAVSAPASDFPRTPRGGLRAGGASGRRRGGRRELLRSHVSSFAPARICRSLDTEEITVRGSEYYEMTGGGGGGPGSRGGGGSSVHFLSPPSHPLP